MAPARMATRSPARSQPDKGQGQWALGHLEPLTPNERIKKDDDGLNVRARIENIYSHAGFASIDPADLRGRLRWWGLYTQRRPGIDGGKTAVLEPHELDDEYFMLRVRIDGGQLTTEQLRVIAQVSTEFARDTADVTDRQNVQLHWIRIEDVPEIWRRLEAVGLSTTEACGDTPRVILGSPVAGIAADEILDGTPGDRRHPGAVHRLAGVLQPAAQVQDRDQRLAAAGRRARGQRHLVRRRRAPRARTRASTSGSAAGCRPTRCSPSGSAPGCRWTTSPTSGPASSASSATTATGGCAPARGSSSWSPTGACEKFRQVLEDEYLGRAAHRRPGPAGALRRARPHRRAPAEGRPLLRRARPDRRPGLRHAARPARRPRRGARVAAGAHHAAPEAGRPRRPRRPGRLAGRRGGRPGPAGPAGHLPARTRWPAPASSSASSRSSRPRPAGPS